MFEKFKIRTAIIEICRIGELEHRSVLDAIPSTMLNSGVELMKKHGATAKDAATYVVTISHANSIANCEKVMDKIDPRVLMNMINILTSAAESAIKLHEARNGDPRCIVLPQDIIPKDKYDEMKKFADAIFDEK